MAYENLKAAIKQAIKNNNNQEITGDLLQNTLLNIIINTVENGYIYRGIATPSTNPISISGYIFYIIYESGNYTNFGLGYINLEGKIGIVKLYNDKWILETINTSTPSIFTAMPLVLTDSLKKAEALEPTNIIANSIIKPGGNIESWQGYSVYEFSGLKKNMSFIIDIKNQLNNGFAIFMIKDTNGNVIFCQLGHPEFTLNSDKRNVINMPCDGSILISENVEYAELLTNLYKPVEIKVEGNYAPYVPFYTVIGANPDSSTKLSPSTTKNPAVLNKNGSLGYVNDEFSVAEYYVKRGKTYYIKINTEITNTDYAEFALYDENDEPYYVHTHDGETPKKNVILAKTDGKLRTSNWQTSVDEIYEGYSTSEMKKKYLYSDVLWIGTSIPEGCKYPEDAANELNFTVYNKAIGASGIVLNKGILNNGRDCKDLSETTAEKEIRYRASVGTSEYITDYLIKNTSFDSVLIPYIDGTKASCKLVMFDHGYNDREQISKEVAKGKNNINWESEDRTTYTGAFRYLLKKIYAVDPTILVVIVGYFSAQHTVEVNCKDVCIMQKWIAEHYHLPIIDTWNLLSVSDDIILGTNIKQFMQFCPDGVHPFTDTSGRSDKLYSAAIIKAMRDYPGRNAGDIIELI